jgi:hypothetical protein
MLLEFELSSSANANPFMYVTAGFHFSHGARSDAEVIESGKNAFVKFLAPW